MIITEEEEEIMIMEEEMSTTTTSTLLPQDILMEILSWLPAKSLINSLKFVCKDWHIIIKDPVFVKMHLNRGGGASINGGSRKSRYNNESLVRKDIYDNTLFQQHLPFNFNCEEGLLEPKKMDIDSNLLRLKSRLVGSCNGLLCVSVNELNEDEIMVILNPSTRKYKVSPSQPIKCPEELIQGPYRLRPRIIATFGFGCYYNSTTAIDEYKVVRIVHFGNPQSFKFQIDIYSMSSNSWRRCREVKDMAAIRSDSGVLVNGAFHWMGSNLRIGSWDTIVSFSIRDEESGQVQMPPCPCDNHYTILMNVRGCLGKVYLSRTEIMDIELDIWVMKEYGIGESWTKEFVIRTLDSDPPRELSWICMFPYALPITCFLTGDKILIELRVVGAGSKDYGKRVFYDMNKKEIDGDFRMFDVPPGYYRSDQVDYIETLVSLKSSNKRKRKDIQSH